MQSILYILRRLQRAFFIALLLSITLLFLFPTHSYAQAILLRSDPAQNAILNSAPTQIHMWFSDDLSSSTSTATVVTSSNKRIDLRNAHISSIDSHEMDVALQPILAPGTYSVLWTTQSADDGSVSRGSFLFSITEPNGTVPETNGTLPGQDNSDVLNGPNFFSFIMVTLIDLGAVFWVGAQLWRTFVLQLTETKNTEQETIGKQAEMHFDRQFSFPLLIVLMLANIGVLVGQALALTNGNIAQSFAPAILINLALNGRFGTYWIMREIVILFALFLEIITTALENIPRRSADILSWLNLILGMALLLALTLSGHAASGDSLAYAAMMDWLHLLAASLWIGCMLYIAIIYLPILKKNVLLEGVHSLVSILPHYAALAITGMLILLVTGPFTASMHMNTFEQLTTTEYGRTLIVKSVLVVALLITSGIHIGLLRPRLAKDYKNYLLMVHGEQRRAVTFPEGNETAIQPVLPEASKHLEANIDKQARRLTGLLQWESLLGITVLICTGLLSIFTGTLQSATTNRAQLPQVKAFTTMVKTRDKQFSLTLTVSPDSSGPNTFTITVFDSHGVKTTPASVSIYATMLEMDMGTTPIKLRPDRKGNFSALANLDMGGKWGLRVEIRTSDLKFHEANVQIVATN